MKNNKALIIIDMQNFFLKHMDSSVTKELIKNQIKVIDICTKKNIPIIELEYACRGIKRGKTVSIIHNRGKILKTIIKENNSGFTDTKLDEILLELKIKEIVLIGVNTNGCIQDTTIGALHRGYEVTTSIGSIASVYRNDLGISKINMNWYMKNTNIFKDVDELVRYLS